MRKTSLIAPLVTLALAAVPAASAAPTASVPDPIAHAATPQSALDTSSPLTPRVACASERHIHAAGSFTVCVHALRALRAGSASSPRAACRAESHRHVKGVKGTPFSRCVVAARAFERSRHARRHPASGAGPR